jgi:hypothetical protein
MKRFLPIAITLAAGIAAAVALSGQASAAPPLAASGGFTIDAINSTFVKVADGNLFLRDHDLATYTGTFTGTHVFDGTVEIFKDGSLSFHGIVTFTGTVAGCGTGTVVFEVDGAADASGTLTRDHQQTLSTKGGLPIHASLDFTGVIPTATYTGTYAC